MKVGDKVQVENVISGNYNMDVTVLFIGEFDSYLGYAENLGEDVLVGFWKTAGRLVGEYTESISELEQALANYRRLRENATEEENK